MRAHTESKVADIMNQMNLAEKETNKNLADFENQIIVIKETAIAKAKKYRQ